MSKTIVVIGYGPGISNSVAERFGREGFTVALVARNQEKLAAGVKALAAKNIRAQAFTADVSNPDALAPLFEKVRAALGPITAFHWNAYAGGPADLVSVDAAALRLVYDVSVTSLVAAVQAALPDLKAQKGAVLATNGGFGLDDDGVNKYAAEANFGPLAIANAAKQKLLGVLHPRLARDGVYAGQVIVTGMVKGTAWDSGNATIDPADVAEKFWRLFSARDAHSDTI
ncbi:MAG TPA: SDR family NAD(P)-dependent oxidoreductase [Polyangiales bacterium]|nr:SDR family NAD(P)-dependent oxidoreductase [Polyangiales bacterium]